MKLVNQNTHFVVVEYQGDKTIFHDKYLEKAMSMVGIRIPDFLIENFGNQSVIKRTDDQFQKAFKEVYYPLVYNTKNFKWVE